MDVKVPGFSAGDRTNLDLPHNQQLLLEALKTTGKPIVLILTNGSALAVNWAKDNVNAMVETWYPGEEGGNAIADVLFGDYNPAGRLPVTFYKSVNDIPAFEDYSMNGRTYKYFEGTPLYAFGYGLSYTSFTYNSVDSKPLIQQKADTLFLSVNIANTGKYDGDEVVQVYVKQPQGIENQPIKTLVAFKRVHIIKGETSTVSVSIPVQRLRHFNSEINEYSIAKGEYEFLIGASSDDIRLKTKVDIW
jgi:beta-glucosidase